MTEEKESLPLIAMASICDVTSGGELAVALFEPGDLEKIQNAVVLCERENLNSVRWLHPCQFCVISEFSMFFNLAELQAEIEGYADAVLSAVRLELQEIEDQLNHPLHSGWIVLNQNFASTGLLRGQQVTPLTHETLICLNKAVAAAFGKADIGVNLSYSELDVCRDGDLTFEFADRHADDLVRLNLLSIRELIGEPVKGG